MRWVSASLFLMVVLWSGAAAAEPYQWYQGAISTGLYPSALGACAGYVERNSMPLGTPGMNLTNPRVEPYTQNQMRCYFNRQTTYNDGSVSSTITEQRLNVTRVGDSCDEGTTYNAQTGACEQDCSASEGATEFHTFLAFTRTSTDEPFPDSSTPITVPTSVCSGSCRYTNQDTTSSITCGTVNGSDRLQLVCRHGFVGTGEQCQAGDSPQQTPSDFGGTDSVPATDPDDPTDPANNCGSTHVWSGSVCTPVFDPDDDGGNGGGDSGGGDTGGGDSGGGDTGGGGDSGGGDTGGGTGGDTGGGGGGGTDDTPYDPSAEWNDAEANALGSATGTTIGESLTGGVTGALEEREEEINEALDQVPETVGDWFGDLPGLSFMDNLFVPAQGCAITSIPLELNGYDFSISIDFCVLSKYKVLLEWIIWCLTGIAVWNVYYSGLRLQNAAASRGGF